MGKYSLVALDTQHIKQYVFPTDKLAEIRGASSLLDHLNRRVMEQEAGHFRYRTVFTNGGAALFLLEENAGRAEQFGQAVQRMYQNVTGGGATLSCATLGLPDAFDTLSRDELWEKDIRDQLDLLYYRLDEAANCLPETFTMTSHPLLRLCDSCGVNYAEEGDRDESRDPFTMNKRYCSVCGKKREEDDKVKKGIKSLVAQRTKEEQNDSERNGGRLSYAWKSLLELLPQEKYPVLPGTRRPLDFHELGNRAGGKEYMALIYADGNGMGQVMEKQKSLKALEARAKLIDDAVYQALAVAVKEHLPVWPGKPPMFPFDLLLVGGDDILMVTPASVALDVALTLARTFREITVNGDPEKKGHTLSIGVVLAPVSYPFGLLHDLADSTLKYAKKEGTRKTEKAERAKGKHTEFGETYINFMTVTGSTSQDFQKVYSGLHEKHGRTSEGREAEFYATLRPYTVEDLNALLGLIREGKKRALGRTKLHQVREAVLKKNLNSSVTEFLSVLRNWRRKQQEFVLEQIYTLGERYQEPYRDAERPETLFPRVTYPWFADGPATYRTSLLDFVELYDFVEQEGASDAEQN